MTIHELIQRSGFPRRTIYYYTQIGLLPPPRGKGKNYEYSEEHLRRLEQIKKLQMARYSLKEIQEILNRQSLEALQEELETSLEESSRVMESPREFTANERAPDLSRALSQRFIKTPQVRVQLASGLELLVQWPLTADARKFLQNNLPELLTILEG